MSVVCKNKKGKAMRILREVRRVRVKGASRFVASEHIGSVVYGIGYRNEWFDGHLLNRVEEEVQPAEIVVSELEGWHTDKQIITHIGKRANIQLTYLFKMLKMQVCNQGARLPFPQWGGLKIAYIGDMAVDIHCEPCKGWWCLNARPLCACSGVVRKAGNIVFSLA